LFVFLGCLHLAGGPYSLMQAYAWTGMLVTYSKTDGLLKGAKDTFSGEKPCELCSKIAAARGDETDSNKPRDPLTPLSFGKLLQDMVELELPSLAVPRGTDYHPPAFPPMDETAGAVSAMPPLPPPERLA
jgi:hypothetical protein